MPEEVRTLQGLLLVQMVIRKTALHFLSVVLRKQWPIRPRLILNRELVNQVILLSLMLPLIKLPKAIL